MYLRTLDRTTTDISQILSLIYSVNPKKVKRKKRKKKNCANHPIKSYMQIMFVKAIKSYMQIMFVKTDYIEW